MIPAPEQTLLLRACLLSGDDARTAWKSWRERVNFEDIDAASYRLLPLAYKNLLRENIEDELLGRLKGIYRHTWVRNQLLFHDAASILNAMQDAGIAVLLLKGAALTRSIYPEAGLHPMNDFDFMVPLADVFRAFAVMKKCGWNHAEPVPLEQLVWCSHAGKWTNPAGRQIDLHWHLLPEGRQPGADDDVWANAVKTEFSGRVFASMDDTDLLWHVCAHGAVGDETPAIRWVADAWTILHTSSTLNWERLIATLRKRKLTLPVGRALGYLREQFGAPVPAEIVAALAAAPVSRVERWEDHIKLNGGGILGAFPLHCLNYIRLTQHDSLWKKATGISPFFRRVWAVQSTWELPVYALKKMINRLPQKTRRQAP